MKLGGTARHRLLRSLIGVLGVTCLLAAGFFLLTVAAVLVPNGSVKQDIGQVDSIVVQDEHVDAWTLCGVLMAYSGAGNGFTAIERAAATFVARPLTSPCGDVHAWQKGETSAATEISYSRYWFGPAVLFRIASFLGVAAAFFTAQQALVVLALIVLASSIALASGILPAVGFTAPLMLATGFTVWSISPPYALPFACACLFGASLALRARHSCHISVIGVVAAGMCVNFLDALSLPALYCIVSVAPAIACLWTIRRGRPREVLKAIVAWYLGYGVAWVAKWVAAMTLFDFDTAFSQLKGQVLFRVSGDVAPGTAPTPATAIRGNVDSFLGNSYADGLTRIAIASLIVGVVIVLCRYRMKFWTHPIVSACMLAVLPFVTYAGLSNHSEIHMWFTYRSLAGSVAVALMLGGCLIASGLTRRMGFVLHSLRFALAAAKSVSS